MQLTQNEGMRRPFEEKNYVTGDLLKVGERTYSLNIQYEDRKTHSGKLKEGIIFLKLSKLDNGLGFQKNIRHLLSRIIAQDFLPMISERVYKLNEAHFGQIIKGVRLKYIFPIGEVALILETLIYLLVFYLRHRG